jgi:hypothetical protein
MKAKHPKELVKKVCALETLQHDRPLDTIFAMDNGTTGGYAKMTADGTLVTAGRVPVIVEQDYTKKPKLITRLDVKWMLDIIEVNCGERANTTVILERPYTFKGYKQVIAAARCHEATLIALDLANIPRQNIHVIDSRQWQRVHFTMSQLKDYDTKDLAWAFVAKNYPKYADASDGVIDAICIAAYGYWSWPLNENSRKN